MLPKNIKISPLKIESNQGDNEDDINTQNDIFVFKIVKVNKSLNQMLKNA